MLVLNRKAGEMFYIKRREQKECNTLVVEEIFTNCNYFKRYIKLVYANSKEIILKRGQTIKLASDFQLHCKSITDTSVKLGFIITNNVQVVRDDTVEKYF